MLFSAAMLGFGRKAGGGRRATIVFALIMAGMATAALLAAAAYRAGQDHRRTAESVLRDYATLAAREMVRRSAMELGYYGYYPLATALETAARAPGGLDEKALVRALTSVDNEKHAPRLVSTVFAWEPRSGALGVARPLADDVRAWLSERLSRGPTPRRGFSVLHAVLSGRPYSFVVAPVEGHASMVASRSRSTSCRNGSTAGSGAGLDSNRSRSTESDRRTRPADESSDQEKYAIRRIRMAFIHVLE